MTPYVRPEMNTANYWKRSVDNTPLIDDVEIDLLNDCIFSDEHCGMNRIFDTDFFEKTHFKSDLENRDLFKKNILSMIDNYQIKNEDSYYVKIDTILSDALEIVDNLKPLGKENRYAIISCNYLALQTIPFKRNIGINTILDFFSITDIVLNEPVLVAYSSNLNTSFYVYTTYGNGWITLKSPFDLKFITYSEWKILFHANNSLKLCENNILNVSFNHLGMRYFWGSINDCSGFVRHIYSHFNIFLPANTTFQKKIPCLKYDVSYMTSSNKKLILNDLPIGAILYMVGHAAIFIGCDNNRYYVINSVGSYIDPISKNLINPEISMVNSLDLLRASGKTWLECIDTISIPWLKES